MKSLEFFISPSWKLNYAGFGWLSAVLTLFLTPFADAGEINWQTLNLTPQQETHMNELESDWHKVHQNVSSQIERDMAELKTILPMGDSQKIRELQTRIMTNKSYLMNESMDTFLKKREMLSPAQRSQLQKMLPCNNNGAPSPVKAQPPTAEQAQQQ